MKSYRKQYAVTLLYALLTISILFFIFNNSLQNSADSIAQSSAIADKLWVVFKLDKMISLELFHIIIRKLAHFAEFCMLGISAVLFLRQISVFYRTVSVYVILFFSLLVAVVDEFIQSFTGRTSSVTDILIDFCGAVTGIILVYVLSIILRGIYRYKISAE